MTKVIKNLEKPNYQQDNLSEKVQNNIDALNYRLACHNLSKLICDEFDGDISAATGGNKEKAFSVWGKLDAIAKDRINKFNKGKTLVILLLTTMLFSSCKVIDSTHRDLEYREAQQFLEEERADERKPATLPYWKVDLHKALLLQKGGQD